MEYKGIDPHFKSEIITMRDLMALIPRLTLPLPFEAMKVDPSRGFELVGYDGAWIRYRLYEVLGPTHVRFVTLSTKTQIVERKARDRKIKRFQVTIEKELQIGNWIDGEFQPIWRTSAVGLGEQPSPLDAYRSAETSAIKICARELGIGIDAYMDLLRKRVEGGQELDKSLMVDDAPVHTGLIEYEDISLLSAEITEQRQESNATNEHKEDTEDTEGTEDNDATASVNTVRIVSKKAETNEKQNVVKNLYPEENGNTQNNKEDTPKEDTPKEDTVKETTENKLADIFGKPSSSNEPKKLDISKEKTEEKAVDDDQSVRHLTDKINTIASVIADDPSKPEITSSAQAINIALKKCGMESLPADGSLAAVANELETMLTEE